MTSHTTPRKSIVKEHPGHYRPGAPSRHFAIERLAIEICHAYNYERERVGRLSRRRSGATQDVISARKFFLAAVALQRVNATELGQPEYTRRCRALFASENVDWILRVVGANANLALEVLRQLLEPGVNLYTLYRDTLRAMPVEVGEEIDALVPIIQLAGERHFGLKDLRWLPLLTRALERCFVALGAPDKADPAWQWFERFDGLCARFESHDGTKQRGHRRYIALALGMAQDCIWTKDEVVKLLKRGDERAALCLLCAQEPALAQRCNEERRARWAR